MSIMQSLFGGGNFPSQPTASGTTVATTEFPKELAPFIKDILEKSKAMQQDASYQPYTGPQIAPFNPLEQEAMSALEAQSRGLAGTDIAQAAPYFTGAKTAIEGLGQQFTGDTAQQFMNPYQQAVTDQAKLKATEDYEAQQNVLAANAIKNQPFGGSRQAITEGMAQGNYLDRLTDIQERGLASAYTQGRAAFEAQKGRELQQANALMGMGAAVPQQAYRDLGVRQQIGETQRAQDQMALDLGTKQFMEEREFPTRALQEYSATVRGFPFQPSTYQTQTSYQPQAGIGQQLINLAGQGLGGYTAFTGQPLQNLFKAEGGITTLPTYYNKTGKNKQMEFPGADMDLSIYDLINTQTPEAQQFYEDQAYAQEQEELAQAQQLDAMDLEYYIDKKNKENLGDRILNMLYAPQRGIKRLFNVPERSEIGNTYRPNLRRAEGGITSLPVVYRYYGTEAGEDVLGKGTDVNFNKVLKFLKIYTPKSVEEAEHERSIADAAKIPESELLAQGFDVGKEGLSTPEYYKMLEESEYDKTTERLANELPNINPNINVVDALAMNPDEGVPTNPYGFEDTSPKDDTIVPVQKVFKPELLDSKEVPLETLPNIETFAEQGKIYGESIADQVTKTTLLRELLEKMQSSEGSIPELTKSIRDAYSPDRIKSLEETASRNLAMDQGLGLIKAFSKSDPTQGIVGNLSTQLGDIATNIGPAQKEYAATLANLENMPFEQAEAIYNIDKDVLTSLGKLASEESSEGEKIQLTALSEDKKNLLALVNAKYNKNKDQALINQETNKINLLANLQADENILKLYGLELGTLEANMAAEAAMGKYNKELIKMGVVDTQDSEQVRKLLADVMFGASIDPDTNQINIQPGKPLDMQQRTMFNKYYIMIMHDIGMSKLSYALGEDTSDQTWARVGELARQGRAAYETSFQQ